MKMLLIGIAILLVLGTGGFLYRYHLENQESADVAASVASSTTGAACAADAKVCPDGSAVGRTGPDCSFAVCAPPNVSLTIGSTTIGFVLPAGYQRNAITSDDSTYIASYIQSTDDSSDASSSVIDIHSYPIPTGQTAGEVIMTKTLLGLDAIAATSTSSFKNVSEGNNILSEVLIGSFNSVVQTAYYFTEPNQVIRFDITEKGVDNWAAPSLDPSTLPQHVALQQMLATLQVIQ